MAIELSFLEIQGQQKLDLSQRLILLEAFEKELRVCICVWVC